MSEPLPPPSLARAREQKISELSDHFAADNLSLDDLERRIERVYKAASVSDLEQITADLRGLAPVPVSDGRRRERLVPQPTFDQQANIQPGYELPHSRMLAIMSSTRRVGRWAVPRDLNMFALMSDTKIDLTNAALPIGGVVNIHVTAVMCAVKIIVPPGMRVVNELHSFMADVRSGADEILTESLATPGTPVVRLRGTALMSEVKVKVRRREEPIYEDED